MQRLFSTLLVVVALGILAGGAYLYFKGGERAEREGFGDGPIPVDVVRVAHQPFADRIEALGTVSADESVVLTARVSETVEEIGFDDGDFVEVGDILVRFSMEEELALLEEARAVLREAEQQLERTRDLVSRGNATRVVLDEQVRIVEASKARLAAAQARVDDRILRAPFAGVLGLRRVSKGTLVSPGTAIVTLDDVFPVKLDFAVPERFLSALKPGQTVVAKAAAYPGEVFEGEVITVNSRVDPVTRAVTVRAKIPNRQARLRPGMLMTVEVINRERLALAVPEEAIVQVSQDHYVFVVTPENTVDRRKVQIGMRLPGVVEIRSGLREGEDVVVAGTMRLRPDTPVKVMQRGVPVERPQA